MCEVSTAGYVVGLVLTMITVAPVGVFGFLSSSVLFFCSVCGSQFVLAPDQTTMLTLVATAAIICAGLATGSLFAAMCVAIVACLAAVTIK